MANKIRCFTFLSHVFHTIPTDIIYVISKYSGKYIHFPKVIHNIYKTKNKHSKYHTKHLVTKTRFRSWSV